MIETSIMLSAGPVPIAIDQISWAIGSWQSSRTYHFASLMSGLPLVAQADTSWNFDRTQRFRHGRCIARGLRQFGRLHSKAILLKRYYPSPAPTGGVARIDGRRSNNASK